MIRTYLLKYYLMALSALCLLAPANAAEESASEKQEPVEAGSYRMPSELEDVSLSGPLVQGGLLLGRVRSGDQVYLGDKELFVDPAGNFVIGLDRDASLVLPISIEREGTWHRLSLGVAERIYNIQKIEGVAQKYVSPDPAQVARSRNDVKRVVAARARVDERSDFLAPFVWPVVGPISGVFGSQRVYNGVPKRPHYGVDIARETGTEIVAPAAGVVTMAEDLYYSGLTIILDHGHGLSSSFLHLSKMSVSVGDVVNQGEIIGEVGATGRVTGPHLDWRMNWTGGQGNVRIDPALLVPPMP